VQGWMQEGSWKTAGLQPQVVKGKKLSSDVREGGSGLIKDALACEKQRHGENATASLPDVCIPGLPLLPGVVALSFNPSSWEAEAEEEKEEEEVEKDRVVFAQLSCSPL
jgi:hypothetical protein